MKYVLFVGQIVIIIVCWSYILFSPKYRQWKTKRKFLNSLENAPDYEEGQREICSVVITIK